MPGSLAAPRTEIHLWRADLDSPAWPGPDPLPAAERARAARLLGRRARRRWVAARWALRGVLARYLPLEPAELELRSGPNGKPALTWAPSPLWFNLSHSSGLALVAVSAEREVGVDVERIDPRRDVLRLADRVLDDAGAAAVAAAAPTRQQAVFHAAWTRREALAKCLGCGLGVPLPDTTVAVVEVDVGTGFAAAVAAAGDEVPSLRHLTIEPAPARADLIPA